MATADAAPAPAKPSQYVVQVGSKQNQTEALATFADMQQKYPTLLASYRPMVQKADLGAKGVWYRLRIGPIVDKIGRNQAVRSAQEPRPPRLPGDGGSIEL